MSNSKSQTNFAFSLVAISALCLPLTLGRVLVSSSGRYVYLLWNLALAWMSLLFIFGYRRSKKHGVKLSLIALAIFFLPNCFYIVTDLIHLQNREALVKIFDVVLLWFFSVNGFILGLVAMLAIHKEIRMKLTNRKSWLVMGAIALANGFAIYIGRYLRWNSWDLLINPLGLASGIGDKLADPASYPLMALTTILFSSIIMSLYVSLWFAVEYVKAEARKKS